MENKEFEKLYTERCEKMEKLYDQEEYCCEEERDVLKLFGLKIEELNDFLKKDEIDTRAVLINILENKVCELVKIFEMFLLARENHLHGVRSVFKDLQDSFKDSEIKVSDTSDNK